LEIAVNQFSEQIQEPIIRVDTRTLCPNDPNLQKILDANGMVSPKDGPVHQGGWVVDQRMVEQRKRSSGPDGREFEFTVRHMVAKRVCQKCGGETILDPYE
jgi:hypothetical protein